MVKLKVTEKTERKRLIEELDKRSSALGFTILDDPTIDTPRGRISIPDIVVVNSSKVRKTVDYYVVEPNGVIAVIETKNPKKDAYVGSYQALKYMSEIGCKNAFATNFNEIVTFRVIDNQTKVDEKSFVELGTNAISAIAEYVENVITDKVGLVDIELSDAFILRMLKGAVEEIQIYTDELNPKDLEEPLGMFFAKTLNFEIEKEEKSKRDLENATKRAAAFLLVNQIVFYHVLSLETNHFPVLTQVKSPFELQWFLDKVLEKNYKPVFGAKVAPLLPSISVDAINRIINATQYMRLKNIKHDLLGKILHSLPPTYIRKRIAAYYTSNSAALLLAQLSIKSKDDIVIDPACGSGTLLVQCYRRKKFFARKSDMQTHKKLLNEIYGIDITLFAAHLAAINLSLQEPLYYTDEVQIVVSDSLKINPGGLVDFQVWTRQVASPDASLVKEQNIPLVDLVIMNPPFTNPRRMDQSYLKFIDWFAEKSGKDKYLHGWRSLHAVFLLHAEDFLKDDGKIAAVLPAAIIYGNYASGVREYFLKKWSINYIISSDVETTFSEQSDFKEILLITSRGLVNNASTKFVTLKVPLTLENAEQIGYKIETITSDYEDDEVRVQIVNAKQLAEEDNWMKFIEPKSFTDFITKLGESEVITTGEKLFGDDIIRGIEIRGPKFFFLPNKSWKIVSKNKRNFLVENIHTGKQLSIPSAFLVRSLRMPEIHDTRLSPRTDYFLLSIPQGSSLTKGVIDYITWGKKSHEKGSMKVAAVKHGEKWYSFIADQIESKGTFGRVAILKKFMPTTRGVLAHYLPYPRGKIWGPNLYYFLSTDKDVYDKVLAAYFNSTLFIASYLISRRQVGKASEEITESILLKLPCINVKEVDEDSRNDILKAFNQMNKIKLPPIHQQIGQPYRYNLDFAISEALGYDDPKTMIGQLYSFVNERIKNMLERQ